MSEAPVKKAAQQGVLRIKKRTLRRVFRIGCLPAAVIGPLAIAGLVILLFLRQAPFWVTIPSQYLFVERFNAGLIVLSLCYLAPHWTLGLMAARGGASAVGRGVKPGPRLIVVRRRLLIPTLALFAQRLVLLAWVAGAGVAAFWSDLFLPDMLTPPAAFIRLDRTRTILALGLLAVLAIYWLVGPFLRTRTSTALGALGAALSPDRGGRRWLAVSARLGLGLAQLLLIAWGTGLVVLIAVTLINPQYSSARLAPLTFSDWSQQWRWLLGHNPSYLVAGVGILLVAGVQYGFSWVYCWAASLVLRLRRGAGS
jgi:hypothetical protein